MRGKWLKRLMRYAVSETLWEKTDPVTEWIIQRERLETCKTRNQTKRNILGRKCRQTSGYAATVENTETDPRLFSCCWQKDKIQTTLHREPEN